MKLNISLNLFNAAFYNQEGGFDHTELEDILTQAAEKAGRLVETLKSGSQSALFDSNGNSVGYIAIDTPDTDDDGYPYGYCPFCGEGMERDNPCRSCGKVVPDGERD